MFAETALVSNFNGVTEKKSLTGASTNLKKLLKTIKKVFKNSKPSKEIPIPNIIYSCNTEEEHQNWLNEKLEAMAIHLH
uniref:Brother of Bearded protein A n=1 Tax=Drosophila melanogaster TaxID=7227 RepID=P83263_DROME|nr:uncharacterized protein Dmel_CG13465 [Drosophila melanogaster]AAF33202.1 Brother of Bearded protein A [Drosophila melanogaster]AAF33203.1 Brother of Bearded protein B [Drosophila melanogaster]AAF33204.1 Brother of Bearded protein C [Drosophila melanogaster]AAF49696.1 uncharacterized protein Dmel_CG13465 [Drosophila melanogaster]|eukprot:NP_525000.1 uncharacterized protein Dmel_CG13465 [Drosophila melanogaster]